MIWYIWFIDELQTLDSHAAAMCPTNQSLPFLLIAVYRSVIMLYSLK